jgi:hypothetical protein
VIVWLNENANAVSAMASVVSAFAAVVLMATTIVYAIYTWQLTIENRLLRKAGTDPQVVACATINPRVFAAIDFVIKNVGRGAARNISYKIVSGGEQLKGRDVRLLPEGVCFAFLPQDDQLSASMGMGWDLLKEPAIKPFEVVVNYEDMEGNKCSGRFRIDVGQFEGLGRLGAPPGEQMADALGKIASAIEGWASRRLQVETMSVTERKEHDEQTRKWIEERRQKREVPEPGEV